MSTGTAVKSELMAQYKALCNDELLAVAAQRDALTVDAQLTLQEELAARHLSPADVEAYAAALQRQEPELSEFDEYVERFAGCTRIQLLRIAAEPHTLTPDMRAALVGELEHRQIAVPDALREDAKLASNQS